MLMLEQCCNIFHVESVTLSFLKVKGYSLHHCNNVFLVWNFCIHHIALHQPVDQKFHLFTRCLSFFPRILFWKYIIKFTMYLKVSATAVHFLQLNTLVKFIDSKRREIKLDYLTYNYCDICTMLMLIFLGILISLYEYSTFTLLIMGC